MTVTKYDKLDVYCSGELDSLLYMAKMCKVFLGTFLFRK